MKRSRWVLIVAIDVALAYLGAYVVYRTQNTQVWDKDGREYVTFGSRVTYLLFRPLSYVDGAVTGMGFHIGPHL